MIYLHRLVSSRVYKNLQRGIKSPIGFYFISLAAIFPRWIRRKAASTFHSSKVALSHPLSTSRVLFGFPNNSSFLSIFLSSSRLENGHNRPRHPRSRTLGEESRRPTFDKPLIHHCPQRPSRERLDKEIIKLSIPEENIHLKVQNLSNGTSAVTENVLLQPPSSPASSAFDEAFSSSNSNPLFF
jgi:hypothetical protein